MPELNIFLDWADAVASYSIYHNFEFEYKHPLMQKNWQCDPNNDIKGSAS